MDYSKEVEELLMLFMLVDFFNLGCQNPNNMKSNPAIAEEMHRKA
jgi:hypothetical protein